MNLRVLGMERKQVAMNMHDERTPYVQQDQEGIDNTNALINNLMVLLDRKRSSATTVVHGTRHPTAGTDRPYAKAVLDLSMIHEPVNLYNQVLGGYLATGSTQHTKEIMLTSIRRLLEPVAFIVQNVHAVIGIYVRDYRANNGHARIGMYFDKLVVALTAYHLMERQLRSGNFYIITASELQSTMDGLLNANPVWKRIFTNLRLDPTIPPGVGGPGGGGPFSGGPFSGPGSGPGSGPFGGPGGGGPGGGPFGGPGGGSPFHPPFDEDDDGPGDGDFQSVQDNHEVYNIATDSESEDDPFAPNTIPSESPLPHPQVEQIPEQSSAAASSSGAHTSPLLHTDAMDAEPPPEGVQFGHEQQRTDPFSRSIPRAKEHALKIARLLSSSFVDALKFSIRVGGKVLVPIGKDVFEMNMYLAKKLVEHPEFMVGAVFQVLQDGGPETIEPIWEHLPAGEKLNWYSRQEVLIALHALKSISKGGLGAVTIVAAGSHFHDLMKKARETAAHMSTNVPPWFEALRGEHEPHIVEDEPPTEGVRRNLLTGDIETDTGPPPLFPIGPPPPIAPHFHHASPHLTHTTFGLNSVPLPPPPPPKPKLLVPTIRRPGAQAPETTSKQTLLQPPPAAGPKETTYRPAPVPPKAVRVVPPRPKTTGSGKRKKTETIETKKALMPYFDIMDDPYFIKV